MNLKENLDDLVFKIYEDSNNSVNQIYNHIFNLF